MHRMLSILDTVSYLNDHILTDRHIFYRPSFAAVKIKTQTQTLQQSPHSRVNCIYNYVTKLINASSIEKQQQQVQDETERQRCVFQQCVGVACLLITVYMYACTVFCSCSAVIFVYMYVFMHMCGACICQALDVCVWVSAFMYIYCIIVSVCVFLS